jgi:hypothetical protein
MAQRKRETTRKSAPPWLSKSVFKVTPQRDELGGRNYIFDRIWKEHPSVREALPRILAELVHAICLHTIKGFYLKMSVAQACILFLFFANGSVLTPEFFAVLGLTFAGLLVREAFVIRKERLEGEIVTTVVTPVLIIASFAALHAVHSLLGWGPPHLMPMKALTTRLVWIGFVVGIVRYHTAPEPGPGHPFRGLLDVHTGRWYFNNLWLAGAFACLVLTELAAPAKWFFQQLLTVTPGAMFFTTGIRLQLNPIGERYRHSMIQLGLFTNPYEEEIRMKRDYLLTGADWFHDFGLQSFCEIIAFILVLTPLLIAVVQWYIGDANAARIDWLQLGANAAGWALLIATWPYVKKKNRETRMLFDQVVQTFKRGSKNNCINPGTSNVMLVRGHI